MPSTALVSPPNMIEIPSADLPSELQLSAASLIISEQTVNVPVELLAGSVPISVARQELGFRSLMSQFFKREFWTKARRIAPWFLSGAVLGINLLISAPVAVIGASLAALTVQVIRSIISSNPFCQKLWKALLAKAGMAEKDVPWVKVSAIGFGSWLAAASPSLAFLETAETLVTGLFTQAAGQGGADVAPLVPLLFGVIRVIFIIYVLVAIIRVISAFRNDEDWSTAARIPMIVVLCVVLGDALSTLIAKGSKAAGG